MKKFYLFIKDGFYYKFNPFYKELDELTVHPVEYFDSEHYYNLHNDLEKVKEVLENFSVAYRNQFQIVEFKFEVVEKVINF